MMLTIGLVAGRDVPAERLDDMSRALMSELREIPGAELSRAPGPPPPPSSKGAESSIAEIIVAAGTTATALTAVFGAIRGWLKRQRQEVSVTVKSPGMSIEFKGDNMPSELTEMIAKLRDTEDPD